MVGVLAEDRAHPAEAATDVDRMLKPVTAKQSPQGDDFCLVLIVAADPEFGVVLLKAGS
jgi:hypothetical protein